MIAAHWPFQWLWSWWLPWLEGAPAAAHVAPLGTDAATRLAVIHAGAFARPWGSFEFERLLAEKAVLADGVFLGSSREAAGFVLSRRVLDEAEILTLAMAPEARGRGFAGILLRHHLNGLARVGIRTLHLEVEEANAPALALYRRHGFRAAGRREGYYAGPDGSRAAALIMTVRL